MAYAIKEGLHKPTCCWEGGKVLPDFLFLEYSFIVWPHLGLSFVSAKPCSQLVLASRDLRPPAILLGSLHSTGAVTLFFDSENMGKIKPALGRACEAVRHKTRMTEGCQTE